MDFLLVLIPIISVSVYSASLASRTALRRGRQPGWCGILGSSLATAVVILVVGYLGVLSVPGDVSKIGGFRH